jgi:hypothetical protein
MTNDGSPNTVPCCELSCDDAAAWLITDGEAPDDYTHACTAHVGELLRDGESVVSPLEMADTP